MSVNVFCLTRRLIFFLFLRWILLYNNIVLFLLFIKWLFGLIKNVLSHWHQQKLTFFRFNNLCIYIVFIFIYLKYFINFNIYLFIYLYNFDIFIYLYYIYVIFISYYFLSYYNYFSRIISKCWYCLFCYYEGSFFGCDGERYESWDLPFGSGKIRRYCISTTSRNKGNLVWSSVG